MNNCGCAYSAYLKIPLNNRSLPLANPALSPLPFNERPVGFVFIALITTTAKAVQHIKFFVGEELAPPVTPTPPLYQYSPPRTTQNSNLSTEGATTIFHFSSFPFHNPHRPHHLSKFALSHLIFREEQASSPTNFGTVLQFSPLHSVPRPAPPQFQIPHLKQGCFTAVAQSRCMDAPTTNDRR